MNRIYFFTGTGNSLHIAEKIGTALEECEIVAIHKDTPRDIPFGYERIGFVFPDYAGGPPTMVKNFISNMKFSDLDNTYLFMVATYGANAGSIESLTDRIFKERGLALDYADKILSYANAISLYPMLRIERIVDILSRSHTKSVINAIVEKKRNIIPEVKARTVEKYNKYMKSFEDSVQDYNVNENCISCEICKKICPANNIMMEDGKPVFCNNCESCMACIQHCPQKAINYKDKTQKRRRYTHPQVGYKKLMGYYFE